MAEDRKRSDANSEMEKPTQNGYDSSNLMELKPASFLFIFSSVSYLKRNY